MNNNAFAISLARMRKEKEWTLEYLGSLTNTSKQVLSRYERNERIPNVYTAAKIAKAFNTNLENMIKE